MFCIPPTPTRQLTLRTLGQAIAPLISYKAVTVYGEKTETTTFYPPKLSLNGWFRRSNICKAVRFDSVTLKLMPIISRALLQRTEIHYTCNLLLMVLSHVTIRRGRWENTWKARSPGGFLRCSGLYKARHSYILIYYLQFLLSDNFAFTAVCKHSEIKQLFTFCHSNVRCIEFYID